ncbi:MULTISPECIES: aminodeoxychorismate lyase [unclassified Pseudomonas]|uniref:aminodeoxychorismate lyase n=1 Tax=unclassified Pseudomonas TaxID=196821 RepID=UPI000BCAC2D1|nr:MULTISPECIES: aminodeoxychorismate lyase [unclassified Pseudomonas]PVZ16164.1 4-amino-4-deoxychorismate lyase [Pseudomonas sp. URIL14HWK12:I12]PVZ25980.1 4-amino-4-deoxychorismate lyase [Pseudomonas sp. URIL14HWK12:I10]PVZ36496.1 4-amino-4-deoxychorismate lyase [Pseudomonas sp. URIL14HWK12:I11]SNZ18558.1 aminodeoxychorismate lyase apoprotein [Pseudomonas sp. URIL14HWK12:I9]
MHAWVDGQPQATLGLGNRGLAYGDGLFETIKVTGGRPHLLARHFARLARGVARLGLPADLALIERELLAYAQAMGEGVLKLILTRGESPRGYAVAPDAPVVRILQASPLPAWPASHAERGVRLFECTTRLALQPALAGLKHLNRLEQVLARAEWQGGEFAEGLMRDTDGRIVEGVFSNLFLVSNGSLLTPDLSRCGVCGTLRDELLAQAPAQGLQAHVADLTLADLQTADEVFVCNGVYGIWPVVACGDNRWPVGGVTRKLQRLTHTLLDS